MMSSVKGLHYALRIWNRQIFVLVIMMLYTPHPHPPDPVLHRAQCFCIPVIPPHPRPPSTTLSSKWKRGKWNEILQETQSIFFPTTLLAYIKDHPKISDVPYLCIWGHLEDGLSRGSSVLIRSVTPSHHSKQMVFHLNVCLSLSQYPPYPRSPLPPHACRHRWCSFYRHCCIY